MDAEFDLRTAPGHLLRRAQQVHAAVFAEVVSEAQLTTPQFAVLAALRSSPEIDQVRLSQRLAIDRSTIADIANRLEERGIIRRRRDSQDGRRNLLSLTAAGLAVYDLAAPQVIEVGQRLLAPLSEKDRKTFLECLTSVIVAYDPFFDEGPDARNRSWRHLDQFGDASVRERSDVLDRGPDLVARLEEDRRLAGAAHSPWCAGEDQVSGIESDDAAGVAD